MSAESIMIVPKKKEAKVLFVYFNIKNIAAARDIAKRKDINAHIIANDKHKTERYEIVAHALNERCKYCD